VACAICGASINVVPNALKRRADQYCSPACGREGQRRKLKELPRKSRHWRTLAKKAYGDSCVICGFSHVVEVHHILPRSKGGPDDLDNLVPLCPNHHAMAHLNLLTAAQLIAARGG
jgi:5-methylcytosine-specific restriction endonuclease McrA